MEGIKRKILSLLMCIVVVVAGFNINVIEAEAANTITIDITGLASGAETSHDCSKYLTSKYDSAQHWQECNVCNKKYSITNHSLITYGTDTCANQMPAQTQVCNTCGYSKILPKRSHTIGGNLIQDPTRYEHIKSCTVCGNGWVWAEQCKTSSGQKIDCKHPGTCAICGYRYTSTNHSAILVGLYNNDRSCNLTCGLCGTVVGTVTVTKTKISTYVWRVLFVITPASGYSFSGGYWTDHSGRGSGWTGSNQSTWTSGGKIYTQLDVNLNNTSAYDCVYPLRGFSVNGVSGDVRIQTDIPLDSNAPSIGTINVNYSNTVGDFSTKCRVHTTITDSTWNSTTNQVYVRIIDSEGNQLSSKQICVKNGTTYTSTIDLAYEIYGTQTLYLEATDYLGNVSKKAFTVSNLDSKAPTVTSSNTTATNWSTSKSYTATATDTGSGGVKIAFNNTDSYMVANQSSNTYSQSYIFTGDVYGSTTGAIYYKDALGNETTQFLAISNIDNTAPTITDTSYDIAENISLTVTANDNKDFGGSVGVKSGSGIAGYAVSKTNSVPSTFQTSNKLTITEDGNYYLFVKDNAGNITSKDLGYLKNTKAKVTVNHYFINRTTRNYPSTPTSTNVVYEEINSQYTAPIQQVSGYDLPDLKTVNVSADGTTTVNYYYDVYKYTVYTYIDKGYGAISEKQKVEPNQNTSVYYYPANGYDVEYVRCGTSNSNLAATPIDILKVFENVQSDYYFHVAYKITETKKSEITKSAYSWIDLKIN